jgi:hypothetical protein
MSPIEFSLGDLLSGTVGRSRSIIGNYLGEIVRQHKVLYLLLIGLLTVIAANIAVAEEASSELLDRIETSINYHVELDDPAKNIFVKSSFQMLKKNGDIKEEETTYYRLIKLENDSTVWYKTDEFGETYEYDIDRNSENDEEIEENAEKDEDEKEHELSFSADPKEIFNSEIREQYQFELLDPDESGNLKIDCKLKKDCEGFNAVVTIDTTTWLPMRFFGGPVPLPSKKIKKMEMDITYSVDDGGFWRPKIADTFIFAKFLILKFRIHSTEEFLDYSSVMPDPALLPNN